MDDKVNVKIEADESRVSAGMRAAADAVRSGVSSIKSAMDNLKGTFDGVGRAMKEGFADGIKQGMDEAVREAEAGTNRLKNSTSGVSSAFGGLKGAIAAIGLATVATDIVKTATEFERLRSVLATLEGSEGGGNARFEELKKFATTTPFELNEVVQSFSRLKSQGLDPSNQALMAYGNTAAAMGKTLDQMVEAVSDAAMGEFERLKEFGIKAVDAGDSVVFNFKGQATTVKKNSEDIQNYLKNIGNEDFAGAMERQMNTLGGMFSNLSDAAANFADGIGRGGLGQALKDVMGDINNAAGASGGFAEILGGVLGTIIKEVWELIKTLGEVVSDVFSTIGDVIRDVVGENVSNNQIWEGSIKTIKIIIIALGLTFKEVAIVIGGAIRSCIVWIEAFVNAANAVSNLDFSGAVSAVETAVNRQGEIFRKGANDMVRVNQEAAANARSAWEKPLRPAAGPTAALSSYTPGRGTSFGGSRGGGGGGGRSGGGGGGNPDRDMVQSLENRLNQLKLARERENNLNNTFIEFSKSEEANYWKNILDTAALSAGARIGVERKYLEASLAARKSDFDDKIAGMRLELQEFRNNMDERLRISTNIAEEMRQRYGDTSKEYRQAQQEIVRIEREKADQIEQINAEIAQSQQNAALDAIDTSERQADLELQLGLITQAELIQRQIQFENERYQINLQALQSRLALMEADPDMNPVEYQRIKDQILQIERQHNAQRQVLNNQLVTQNKQVQLQATQSLSQSWGGTLAQMLVGQKTFAQGVRALWQGLVGAITQALTQMIAQWIARKIAALILDKALSGTSAASQIIAQAGVAGAAAIASTAAIPIIGPALAPAAGAAASAAAMGFLPLAFAERGYDIPAGVNPITQLHQKEMVLPAEQAEVIRGMANGGGGLGGSPIHFHASPGMTQSEMERHAATLVKILSNAHKNREFSLK